MAADGRRVIKEGFLNKHNRHNSCFTGGLLKNWRRRYFKLFEDELAYYTTQLDAGPRHSVNLTSEAIVLSTNDLGFSIKCFVVNMPPHPAFYLEAESVAEKNEWVRAIQSVVERTNPGTAPPPPPPPVDATDRVVLDLTVVEARNLVSSDYNGLSDPYCVVSVIGRNGKALPWGDMKTNHIRNTCNPMWKEKFTIGRQFDLHLADEIQLDLVDHDRVGKHDSLGCVRVSLNRFRVSSTSKAHSEVVDQWFRIQAPPTSPGQDKSAKPGKVDYGELHLIMSLSGSNLVEFIQSMREAALRLSRAVSAGKEHSDNRLEVAVMEADGLTITKDTDLCSPYCELSLLDDHGTLLKDETVITEHKEDTRNPKWKGEHKVLGRICPIDLAATLRVRVLDFYRKECMGCASIDLTKLEAYDYTGWYALELEAGMAPRSTLGKVFLRIVWVGETYGERKRRQQIDKELSLKVIKVSDEQEELENAQNELHEAACKLDGARIACAANDYQTQHPQFYGINGSIQHLNSHITRAHRERDTSDDEFQAQRGLDGLANLEVVVKGINDESLKATNLVAKIEVNPTTCVAPGSYVQKTVLPMKRIATETSGAEAKSALLARRVQAEVSPHRKRLSRNEFRSEKKLDRGAGTPLLRVEVLAGHELIGVDRSGYSDPYCTLILTERESGKLVDSEKKRTEVISATLNPKWTNEVFIFGEVLLILYCFVILGD